jgi:hypothetical protein
MTQVSSIERDDTLLRLIRHGIEALRDGDGDAMTARVTMANLDQLVVNYAEDLEAAVRCVENAQREEPMVTVWAIFTHLEGRCACGRQ